MRDVRFRLSHTHSKLPSKFLQPGAMLSGSSHSLGELHRIAKLDSAGLQNASHGTELVLCERQCERRVAATYNFAVRDQLKGNSTVEQQRPFHIHLQTQAGTEVLVGRHKQSTAAHVQRLTNSVDAQRATDRTIANR